MYICKTISELTAIDYDNYRNHKLCYVEYVNKEFDYSIREFDLTSTLEDNIDSDFMYLYFTPLYLKKQWGDDWDDAPYEYNSGIPYDHDDNNNEIEILVIKVFKDGITNPQLPSDMFYSNCDSRVSTAQINSKCCAWIYISESYKKCDGISILAGENPSEVIRKLKIGNVIL